jgi:hypothetical protein
MNDEKARERMRNLTVDMLHKILMQAEMLENVTGMKPVLFMSRRTARLFAAGWPLEYKKVEPDGVERIRIEGYDVTICDVEDGVYVGYRI